MRVTRVEEGLWYWAVPSASNAAASSPVPAGTPGSVYVELDGVIYIVDPVLPSGAHKDEFWRALDRDVERTGLGVLVVATCEANERDYRAFAGRYAAMKLKAWQLAPEEAGQTREPGQTQPAPLEFVTVRAFDETALWLPAHSGLVVGRALVGVDGSSLRWADNAGVPGVGQPADAFRAMLALNPRHVLTCVGPPVIGTGARALARVLR